MIKLINLTNITELIKPIKSSAEQRFALYIIDVPNLDKLYLNQNKHS